MIIDDIISYDPSSITITRHTKSAKAGGFTWDITTLDPQTVRIYRLSPRNMTEIQTESGEVKRITHGILASPDADIVVGHDSYDTFEYDGRTFRIYAVRRYVDSNIDEHIQADCGAV